MADIGTPLGAPQMARDARKAKRKKFGTRAWVRLEEGGFSVRPCTVVDMSDTGVRLEIDNPQLVTDPFVLVLSRTTGQSRRCRVKWRRGSHIGAQFIAL
jgi:hypothetical protein